MKDIIILFLITVALIGAGYGLTEWAQPVQAKSDPEPCTMIEAMGGITTWQCEDMNGQPYLKNSVGFLTR